KMLVGFDSDIETARASQDTAQKNLVEEESELKLIRQQIVNCMVYAPAGGQVVHANKQSSRSGSEFIVEPGAMVRERQTIIYLPDTDRMQVKAKVNEGRVAYVRVGQQVKIKVGALEGQELDGVVEKVNPYAEPTGYFSSGVKEYATYIRILDPPATIRTGMSAEVSIFVQSENNALQVPVQVLHEENTELYCLVRSAKNENVFVDKLNREFSVEVRELEFETSNEKTLVVSGGLNEKEKVVRNPRLHEDILNRLVYNYRAQWLLDNLDSNKDNQLTREELGANKFETVVETIIESIMLVDGSNAEGLALSAEEFGDGNLVRDELAVFVEDGDLYVAFKNKYIASLGADKLVASQDSDKDDALNQEEFGKLTASIQASSEEGNSLKTLSDEYKPYNIKESMLQSLGQASFVDLDENSNQSVGWYEMGRYLQSSKLRTIPKPSSGGSGGSVAGGGAGRPAGESGRPGAGGSGRPGGGESGRSGGGGGGDPSQFIGFMMDRMDTDKDGVISKSEIDASSNPDQLREADTDGDGSITKEELLESVKKRMAAGGGQRAGGQRKGGGQSKGGGSQ
ncbi:MAG: efflux RND transporter periplasmic adaptor subunit, partial [Pirellulaceae bacterium]